METVRKRYCEQGDHGPEKQLLSLKVWTIREFGEGSKVSEVIGL